jgi:thiamine pyrophosphate-dependent acetolactate synthase large subunit-like protein
MTPPEFTVADAVGETLAAHGVDTVFGLLGSGNLVVTNALVERGARFVAARHEGGAVCMADGWARVTGRVGVCSVHQGPGLTNTLTGLTEAAKSHTPLLVLAGDTPAAALRSNFRIDQHDLVASVGGAAERIHSAATARADAARALRRAALERRPVVLMLPIDLQAQPAVPGELPPVVPVPAAPGPSVAAAAKTAAAIDLAERPLFLGGRGAVACDAGPAIAALADECGALLATSAVAHGLFAGSPWNVGISGGFASPTGAELIAEADLIVAFGATLNHWTTRHGALVGPGTRVIQVDVDPGQILETSDGVVGDARAMADALRGVVARREGWRTDAVRERIAAGAWRDVPYEPGTSPDTIDPRALTSAVEALLPDDRVVAVDSGHLTGWPAMFLSVPDARSWLFCNGFQAVGLGLGNAIGASVAEPGRPVVAAVGDGGLFLALQELETAARIGARVLVLVYDDQAYGAEVHHFAPQGRDVTGAQFPPVDVEGIAKAAGCDAITVRSSKDLEPLKTWTDGPLVVDARVDPTICADWLAEAFRGG